MSTLASLLNLSAPDLFIILGIVLLLFGAKKFPELARGMSEGRRELGERRGLFEMSGLEFMVSVGIALLLLAAVAGLINRHP